MSFFKGILLLFLVICALATSRSKNLLTSVIIYMSYSLVMCIIWIILESPDLAITEAAVATYACIAYAICIVYLILQGVGDGSQPLLSQYYGERNFDKLKSTRTLAYGFALFLSVIGCIILFLTRESLGVLFGASKEVNTEIGYQKRQGGKSLHLNAAWHQMFNILRSERC